MRIVVAIALAVLVVVGAAVHALWPRESPAPRTDLEALMRVHADFVEAFAKGDYDEVWDLLASASRTRLELYLEWVREHPEEDFGIDDGELRTMDVRTFLEVGLERYAERHPESRRAEIALLRSLRIREVEMRGDEASVRYHEADWSGLVPDVWERLGNVEMAIGLWRWRDRPDCAGDVVVH